MPVQITSPYYNIYNWVENPAHKKGQEWGSKFVIWLQWQKGIVGLPGIWPHYQGGTLGIRGYVKDEIIRSWRRKTNELIKKMNW